ncbi:MAG TPA: hypothetical protein VMA09_21660 [Candidatus Binataceae bacterium]|nr:hypothetical protein [Candidatus Binataceae bacterium]
MPDQHRKRRVPHLRGDEAHVFAGAQQQRRVRVPALVERPMPEARAAQQTDPVTLADVVEVERLLAALVHEYEWAAQLSSCSLLLKRIANGRQHDDVALTRCSLRQSHSEAVQVPADFEEPFAEIDVIPAQRQCLARPQSGKEENGKERPLGKARRSQERLDLVEREWIDLRLCLAQVTDVVDRIVRSELANPRG